MERYSWAVGIDENTGLITVEDARLSVSALITPTGLITSRTGIIPTADVPGEVTATSPTPNGTVHVSAFRAVLQSGRGGGTYLWCLDETKPIDILGTEPADPANDRIDLIVWQQSDTFFTDPDSDFEVRHIVGTPAAVPVDPEVDGSEDYVIRARITVPAGATTLDDSDIENVVLPWTVAAGGILPVRDQAERDAVTAPYDGMAVWRQDRDWAEVYDGSAWRVQGVAICTSEADRDSAITHPRSGQYAATTDADTLWQYDGATAAWVPAHAIGVIGGRDITGSNSLGGTITVTETMPTNLNSGTVSLLPNRRYRIHARFKVQASSTGDDWVIRIREGTTAFTGGTPGNPLRQFVWRTQSAPFGYTYDIFATYKTGTTAESRVFSVTGQAGGVVGGTLQFLGGDDGDDNIVGVWVEDTTTAAKVTVTAS